MRLSVIIPLYNCEPVIERCLNSIDTFEGQEIIVVDDGSSDKGADVVNSYINNHPNVKLIQKENGGASSARNVGIDNATGDYLMFVDADDYLVHGNLERLLEIAEDEQADVLKYTLLDANNRQFSEETNTISKRINYSIIRGIGKPLESSFVSDYHVVDGLFRRSTVVNNNIRLHEDLYLHEDDVFMGELYSVSQCTISTQIPLYRYVTHSEYSHTHHPTPDRAQKIVDSALLAIKYRIAATKKLNNSTIDNLERIKYMRFVYLCSRHMLSYNYRYKEYCDTLEQFRPYGCFPLKYKWLKEVSAFTFKNTFKTFLCNHPRLAWLVYKHRL